jgi:hypothetical protein
MTRSLERSQSIHPLPPILIASNVTVEHSLQTLSLSSGTPMAIGAGTHLGRYQR